MQLRPYQLEDVEFIKSRATVGLFNEQRTGKTPTALTALKEKGCKKIIIVCPASTKYPWKDEFEKWTGMPCVIIEGSPTKRKKLIKEWTNGAVISYDLFKETKNSEGCVQDILNEMPEAIIIDEAHRIKSPKSATTKAIFKCVNKIPIRLALSGTPAPNRAYEIYSILHFLKPAAFNSYHRFLNGFFLTAGLYNQVVGFKPGMEQYLQKLMSDFCTSRKRIEVMPWLPRKNYTQIHLPLSKDQSKYLMELKKYYETDTLITQGDLDRLIRYRQICLHPQLVQLKGDSPKLNWILDYLKDYPETPTIIFTKFTSFIHILSEQLKKKGIKFGVITGSVTAKQRAKEIAEFQMQNTNVIIIQIDAGKEGLTLDRAETIIFTDKFPPAADIAQAEDRFVATTEARKDKPHNIYELIMKDSYDEVCYQLVHSRASETDAVNNFKKYLGG